MAWLEAYACTSAAGKSAAELWRSLSEGHANSTAWPQDHVHRAYLFEPRAQSSVRDLLTAELCKSFSSIRSHLGSRFGVILASTKGMSDDFIWHDAAYPRDPLTPLLENFLLRAELTPARSLCVSNACSSALAAISVAETWMADGLEQVLIIAADAVTPFVMRGFNALKLISADGVRPFAADRSGFFLGEGAACLLLRRKRTSIRIHPIGLDSDGSTVTRPEVSSHSVARAARRIPTQRMPDLIIAHGTATQINDETEARAFHELFGAKTPPITGSKWCVGHTLAASGALDVIAAALCLENQAAFGLATSHNLDRNLPGLYLTEFTPLLLRQIMVSSLGFGGMHAVAMLERE